MSIGVTSEQVGDASTEPQPEATTFEGTSTEQVISCVDGQTEACYPYGEQYRGIGSCQPGTRTCKDGQWGSCDGATAPGKERCDGKDNDCNGTIDDPFTKLGTPCTKGQGACAGIGVVVCAPDRESTICDAKEQTGSPEVCDDKDNDCDGKVDNLATNETCDVPNASGACKQGLYVCVGGQKRCISKQAPSPELCDGKDNDCNGAIDETFPSKGQSCRVGSGECQQPGSWVCKSDGIGVECSAKPKPGTTEVCDGKDNDCNGIVDDNCTCTDGSTQACYSKAQGCTKQGAGFSCVGSCKAGTQTCTNGTWGPCNGDITPTTEVCDGKDNDCNGQDDDNIPLTPCTRAASGDCAKGQETCQAGKVTCVPLVQPSPEVCDGKDNDCDGTIDEDIPALPCQMAGQKGECAKGSNVCANGQVSCQATNQPSPEVCDGKDNDCDGQVDEDNPGAGGTCQVAGKKGECAKGSSTCYQGQLVCQSRVTPTQEQCDSLDNNCDGQVDNGLTCSKGSTRCGGLDSHSIYKCNNNCSRWDYSKRCNTFGREYCNGGQCKKCPCRLNDRKCAGSAIQACVFSNGVCGWNTVKTCSKGCRDIVGWVDCR